MNNTKEKFTMEDLALYVRLKTKLDLSKYRPATLQRKVSHRMLVLGCDDIEQYMKKIFRNPKELDYLTETVTIHVTQFFRDRDVFDFFAQQVISALSEKKKEGSEDVIRVWSAGCATGEEAYSLAILLDKYLRFSEFETEILGTDISEESCETARKGIYPAERMESVPFRIKNRYFDKVDGGYRICPDIKKKVSFATHDLFTPPPFSNIDVILCRNVLIHFRHKYREEVMRNFYSVLNEKGFLMLGKSEAVCGEAHSMFKLINPSIKIYRKIEPGDHFKED